MEQLILGAALQTRDAYDQLEKYHIHKDLSDQGKVLWEIFTTYYKKDSSAKSVDKDIIKQVIARENPKHESMFNPLIDSLVDVSVPNLMHEVIAQKKDRVSLELTQALSSGKEDRVNELLTEWEQLQAGELEADDKSEILIAPNLQELFESRSAEHRIPIYPEALNNQLEGGALLGHHIVVFAPTDMGKSFFALNMLRGFVEHGYKTLYVGNEDPISDLIERFLMSLTGKDKWTIRKHYDRAQTFAEKKGWDNVVWAGLSPGTLGEIRSLIEEHQPQILIVDQIRNLNTGDKDFVRVLEKAAQGMRNFAKQYNLLSISITQAADSATGKAILNRGDIDNSNVGIPGTADLMLGIGATEEQEFDGIRTLSFPKNKISGNKNPIQVMHNYINMRIE